MIVYRGHNNIPNNCFVSAVEDVKLNEFMCFNIQHGGTQYGHITDPTVHPGPDLFINTFTATKLTKVLHIHPPPPMC